MITQINENPRKMKPWMPKGRFFEVQGRFWKGVKNRRFFDRPRSVQKSIKSVLGAPGDRKVGSAGAPGGRRVAGGVDFGPRVKGLRGPKAMD